MTKQELKDLYIDVGGLVFTPRYTFEYYDEKLDEYIGFVIINTTQEVYDEWLLNKDKPPIPEPVPPVPDNSATIEALEKELMLTNQMLTEIELELLEMKGGASHV